MKEVTWLIGTSLTEDEKEHPKTTKKEEIEEGRFKEEDRNKTMEEEGMESDIMKEEDEE